jgi:hypothetical protein
MPTKTVLNEKKRKIQLTYNESEGRVTIWYKESNEPEDNQFGKIVESVRLAREMVDKALQLLPQRSGNDLVKKVLDYHFRTPSEKQIKAIIESFEHIKGGLDGQVILCLAKALSANERGQTTDTQNVDDSGFTIYRIHLNTNILCDLDEQIARTIVHEASHAFAETPGTTTSKRAYDEDDEDTDEKEVYVYDKAYQSQEPKEAKKCADSYAWGALSLFKGFLCKPN